jgi:hypothetical protein
MKKYQIYFFVAAMLWLLNNFALAVPHMKKFENPAMQFVGTWVVKKYDFREFNDIPSDFKSQFQENAAGLPVGMRIRFQWTGTAGMPGGINLRSMEFNGPRGETLSMTMLYPDLAKLCGSYWDFICRRDEDYINNLMIVQIERWDDKERERIWSEVIPIEYNFIHLAKTYGFNVWVAKNGSLILSIILNGQGIDGEKFATMGVYLQKID